MISTRDLSGLPDIAGFRKLTQALAMLDAILSPEWQDRYYSFNSRWADGEMMASMRNGCGDHWFALLTDYYERKIAVADVAAVYRHASLTEILVRRLNPEVDLESLGGDMNEIGYPQAG